jgi:hypothetical protein
MHAFHDKVQFSDKGYDSESYILSYATCLFRNFVKIGCSLRTSVFVALFLLGKVGMQVFFVDVLFFWFSFIGYYTGQHFHTLVCY